MKKIFNLIILSLILFVSKAQEQRIGIMPRLEEADYIFEGKIINSTPYFTSDGRYIYTSNTVYLTNILKGNLSCGTVEVITDGGQIGETKIEVSHSLKLHKGNSGIFLCHLTSKELSSVSFYPVNNNQKLEAYLENQSFIKYWYDGQKRKATDFDVTYDSLQQIYGLSQFVSGLTIITCGTDSLMINPTNPHVEKTPASNLRPDYESNMALAMQKATKAVRSASRANETLNYSLSTPIITGTNPKYFEFDILLSDNDPGHYFNNGLVRLNYTFATFGQNIAANNKITVTRGTVINDPNSYLDPTPGDISFNEVAIPLTGQLYPQNLFLLDATPTQAAHVKIEIGNCNSPLACNFTSQSIMLFLSFYSDNAQDTAFNSYVNVQATQTILLANCNPQILGFSPTTINGGVGQTVQIQGYGFGATQGKVRLKNPDDGGMLNVTIDSTDIVSWSDTSITFVVPSMGVASSGDTVVPGSGLLQVVTAGNVTVPSLQSLEIYYSIDNDFSPTTGTKLKLHLAPWRKFNNKYPIYLDAAFSTIQGGMFKAVIQKAIRDWNCVTGIDWFYLTDTIPWRQTAGIDSTCIIQFGPLGTTPLGLNILAKAAVTSFGCGNTIADFKKWMPEFDIIVNDKLTIQWFCDTTGATKPVGSIDLYEIMLHELGHAHLLNHVNNLSNILYYQYSSFAPRKIVLSSDLSAADGGQYVMSYSNTANIPSLCPAFEQIGIFSSNFCAAPNGIIESDGMSIEYNVYPNPFNTEIEVTLTGDLNKQTNLSLYDVNGRLVSIHNYIPTSNSLTEKINTESLQAGLYILKVKSGTLQKSIRLIKL